MLSSQGTTYEKWEMETETPKVPNKKVLSTYFKLLTYIIRLWLSWLNSSLDIWGFNAYQFQCLSISQFYRV